MINPKKEMHIWLYEPAQGEKIFTNYMDTFLAVERGEDIIHTTQIHFCDFRYGYRIFVHFPQNQSFEITLGVCKGTNREIKEGQNLQKMILTDEFFSWKKAFEDKVSEEIAFRRKTDKEWKELCESMRL